MAQKTALSVQSLSCHGKSSLTEALPIISASGISLSVLPTALLSTHTGGFGTPVKIDTTSFLAASVEHYKREEIKFDGIYTGYFSDIKQIDILCDEIPNLIKDDALVFVDPVMGDNGKFFSGITEEFVAKMLTLCKKADVIVPNVTESYFLCGEGYKENPTENELFSLAVKLFNITRTKVVITGIEKDKKIGSLIFDGSTLRLLYTKKINSHFHGTGDMLASVMFGGILKGLSIDRSVKKAQKFISRSISKTVFSGLSERNGIDFESHLKILK